MRENNSTVVLGHTVVFVFPFQTSLTTNNKRIWNVIFSGSRKTQRLHSYATRIWTFNLTNWMNSLRCSFVCLLILLFEIRLTSIYLTTCSIDAVQTVRITNRFIYHIRWNSCDSSKTPFQTRLNLLLIRFVDCELINC